MAEQFDVFRTGSGMVVVVIQHDLHGETRTRAVAALIPDDRVALEHNNLNPVLEVAGRKYTLTPQFLASLTLQELGEKIGSLAADRDKITRAIDTLLAGV